MVDASEQQENEWQRLHDLITQTVDRYGLKDAVGEGDYWLYDDNLGWYRHQLEFNNPRLFHPEVVKSLQSLLSDFPDWDISIRVTLTSLDTSAPGMGLVVSSDKIIDQLQRQYLPDEFRDYVY
jgi:hypothetical protein